jgi:hypothetical protein
MFNKISVQLKAFDSDLTNIIHNFLRDYGAINGTHSITSLLPTLSKIVIYALPLLLLFAFLKFLYPYNSLLSWILFFLLGVVVLTSAGIFLGFFQLLYAF